MDFLKEIQINITTNHESFKEIKKIFKKVG
jgi:hypothetical protein